ncbi:MAG: cellobiose phosphorylase, partial [Bacillota bacterium]
YVNRAQGISGYGLQDKGNIIMEFTPANKAYESVGTIGFRTFYKINGAIYEPFKGDSDHFHKMMVDKTAFTIEETNKHLGVKTKVTYFGLPGEPIAGLVRKVTITNLNEKPIQFELLDGITEILPSGINNAAFKGTSNILQSWMDVNHLDEGLAYYSLRASTSDSSEVQEKKDGNFYVGIVDGRFITPIVDQDLVFGYNSAKTEPTHFQETPLSSLRASEQVTANKISCGFIPVEKTLEAGASMTFHALSGHAESYPLLKEALNRIAHNKTLLEKEEQARRVVEDLLDDVTTDTAHPAFNEYIKQNYLDNFLRGGYPIEIGDSIYHLYSRRHGDLERDYNYFSLAPEYYSQGAGNFRDVAQNRRMDTRVNPKVERFNIHHFASLIQLDGYNPLSVKGTLYSLDAEKAEAMIKAHFEDDGTIEALFKRPFTPGQLVNLVENHDIPIKTDEKTYLDAIIKEATPSINAAFGEGFWSDHFTYLLDLVESFEAIYPDRLKDLLYRDESFLYFESPVSVLRQHEKTVKKSDGTIRQYGSLRHPDQEKIDRLGLDPTGSNFTKIDGEPYRSNLLVKLLSLVLNKHSLLDPEGLGIEMEANKPGWNDAMNGVPGLHGSGVGETIETLRIVEFLIEHLENETITLPIEMKALLENLMDAKGYADRVEAREAYRENIRFGLSGTMDRLDADTLERYLRTLKDTVYANLKGLFDETGGMLPTFLTYEVTDYDPITENGEPVIGHYGLPIVKPKAFKRRNLPTFLEAPARLFKVALDRESLRRMHRAITKSGIYDDTLKFYKTSEDLTDESHEIGRIRAFTQGWLERESNFLHMTYKYLLGLLKAGLYDEYYEAIETNLVCFMDPEIYGRSTLENSSFIVPSNNPDKKIHGQGFFARLSGSTVEVINMWACMMAGNKPFRMEGDELVLKFEPKLKSSFFKEDGTATFRFLKTIDVTYINGSKASTYEQCDTQRIELIGPDGLETIDGDCVRGAQAERVREGHYKAIKIHLN